MPVPPHTAGEDDPFTNTATASGSAGGQTVTDTDRHEADILHPQILLDKTGPASIRHGQTLDYTLVATNPGDTAALERRGER